MIKRYDFVEGDVCGYKCSAEMIKCDMGDYIKIDDLAKLLNNSYLDFSFKFGVKSYIEYVKSELGINDDIKVEVN